MGNFYSDDMKKFFEAVLLLDSMEECYSFFEDICTVKELQDISQRLEVARMLKCGKAIRRFQRKQEQAQPQSAV